MTEAALAAAQRGEQLNQQTRAFARREALRPIFVGLDDQLRQAETLIRRAVGECANLSFIFSAPDDYVRVDPGQLEAAALKMIVTEPGLELMLTDVIMPGGKNGLELALEVTEIRPGLPVILSCGYTGESLAGAEAAPCCASPTR